MAKLKFNWKNITYSVCLLAVLGGLFMLMGAVRTKSNEQACTDIRIVIAGEEAFVEQEDIARLIEDHFGPLVGRTLNTIPIHDIETQLRTIPYVEQAVVNTDMNGALMVRVWQRKAVLRIINQGGEGFYVDANRLKMPISLSYVPKVAVANGFISEELGLALDTVETRLVEDIFKTVRFISDDELWNEHIVQLYVNEQADIELVPKVGNQRIILGNADHLEDKFSRLEIFYRSIVPKMGIDAYKTVNLKYTDQLVCIQNENYERPKPADQVTENLVINEQLSINSTNIQ